MTRFMTRFMKRLLFLLFIIFAIPLNAHAGFWVSSVGGGVTTAALAESTTAIDTRLADKANQSALEDTAATHVVLIGLKLPKNAVRDSIYVGLAASDSSKFPAGKLSTTNIATGGSYTANVLTANSFAYTSGNTPHFIKSYPTIQDSIYCSVHDSLDVLPVYNAAVDDTSKRIQFKSIGAVRDTLRLGDIMIPPIASYDSVIVFAKFSDADSANAKTWIKIYNAGETILQTTVDGTVANTFERFAYPITEDFDPNEEYKLEYTAILNTTLSCEITGIRLKCAD